VATAAHIAQRSSRRDPEEEEKNFRALMVTQDSQAAVQTEEWVAAKASVRAEAQKAKKARKYVCPRMISGRACDGSSCRDTGNGGSNGIVSDEFRHPPVCKDPAHQVRRSERPDDGCVLWHLGATTAPPKAKGGSKGYNNNKFVKNGGGNPRVNPLEKEVDKLKKAAANREIELAKANARHKAFKQATAAVSYSQALAPTQAAPQSFPRLGTKTKGNGNAAAAAAAAAAATAAVATPATQTKEVSVEDLKTFMRQMAEMSANMAAKAAALCA
jgi:hypothetical protein